MSITDFVATPKWPVLRVVGPDAATWLQGIVTCNVLGVTTGQTVWGSLLSKVGKVQADLQISGKADDLLVAVSGGEVEEVRTVLDGYLVMEDAEIDRVPNMQVAVVEGDRIKSHFEAAGLDPRATSWGTGSTYLVIAASEAIEAALLDFGGTRLPDDDFHAFCLEVGFPVFGLDYTSADNLHDVTLERRTVDWTKGCYLGQEVVCMQDMRGKVKKRLVRIDVSEGADLLAGVDLCRDGEVRGQVIRSLGRTALARVKAPDFETGSELEAGASRVRVRPLWGV